MNRSGTRTPITPEGVVEHPVCPCHSEPMLWQKDRNLRAGGWWACRVKRQQYNATRRAQRIAWAKAKKERDPFTRIAAALYDRRRKGLRRKAARHCPAEEGS